jgi:hypothetical protein
LQGRSGCTCRTCILPSNKYSIADRNIRQLVIKKAIGPPIKGRIQRLYEILMRRSRLFQALYRLRINDALVPPNPKELLMAYSTSACRATLGM